MGLGSHGVIADLGRRHHFARQQLVQIAVVGRQHGESAAAHAGEIAQSALLETRDGDLTA